MIRERRLELERKIRNLSEVIAEFERQILDLQKTCPHTEYKARFITDTAYDNICVECGFNSHEKYLPQ